MRASAYVTLVLSLFPLGRPLAAQEAAGGPEARVWLDRGDEPVLRRGEEARVYYRTSEDAFAAIFRIDTDGRVHLIYPQHPDAIDVVRGERDYRLLFPDGPSWRVSEDPGVGYLFIIASPEPLDFSRFPYDEWEGWDVSGVGEVVYSDPYVAIDDYVAEIVPDWEVVPYALDFVTYTVGEVYTYPRFLCYDCHTYRSYSSWNPYDYTCSTYRVVIWDDPYFYPRYRYSGVNVVFAQPLMRASLPRYEVTRRVRGDAVAPIVRARSLAERRAVAYKEPAARAVPTASAPAERRGSAVAPAARSGSAAAPTARRSATAPASERRSAASVQERPRPTAAPQQVPDSARARPTLQRRPSARLPVRTPPAARGTPAEPAPRAAPSRPSGQPSSGARREPQAPQPQVAPGRPRAAPSTTRPSPPSRPEASPTPSRPRVRAVPSPSSGGASSRQPTSGARPQAAPGRGPSASGGGADRPARASGGGARSAPSRPTPRTEPSRPSPRAEPPRGSGSPPARASAPPRSTEPRPTVRARPAGPAPRN